MIAPSIFCAGASAAFGLTLRHLEYSAIFRDANSRVIGYASIEPSSDNKTSDVTVRLNGGKSGTVRGWEVRKGTCAKPGNVWGNPVAYKPLTADGVGVSNQKTNIAIELPDFGDFHVSVKPLIGKTGTGSLCADFYLED